MNARIVVGHLPVWNFWRVIGGIVQPPNKDAWMKNGKEQMKPLIKILLLGLLSACTIQPLHAQVSTGAGLGAQSAVGWTSATAQNTFVSIPINITPTAAVAFNISGSISGGVITFEATTAPDGNSNWQQAVCYRMGATPQSDQTYTLTGANQMWQCPAAGANNFRVRLSTVITGTGTANITLQGSSGIPGTIATLGEKRIHTPFFLSPAAGSQATISAPAGAAGVRNVADCVSFTAGAIAATVATQLNVNLRDGASGAGTVLQSWAVSIPTTVGQDVTFGVCGLNIQGSPATAMTLEWSAALAALAQSVSLTTYTVQ